MDEDIVRYIERQKICATFKEKYEEIEDKCEILVKKVKGAFDVHAVIEYISIWHLVNHKAVKLLAVCLRIC